MERSKPSYFANHLKCLRLMLVAGVSFTLVAACVSEQADELLRQKIVGVWLDEDTFANISYSITLHFQEDGVMTAEGSIYQNDKLLAEPKIVAIWTVRNGTLRTETIKEAGDTFPSHSVRYDKLISVTNLEMKYKAMEGNIVRSMRVVVTD